MLHYCHGLWSQVNALLSWVSWFPSQKMFCLQVQWRESGWSITFSLTELGEKIVSDIDSTRGRTRLQNDNTSMQGHCLIYIHIYKTYACTYGSMNQPLTCLRQHRLLSLQSAFSTRKRTSRIPPKSPERKWHVTRGPGSDGAVRNNSVWRHSIEFVSAPFHHWWRPGLKRMRSNQKYSVVLLELC